MLEDFTERDREAIQDIAWTEFHDGGAISADCSAFGSVIVEYRDNIYLVADDETIIRLPGFLRHKTDVVAFVMYSDERYKAGRLDGLRQAKQELRDWLDGADDA
jgi:hypothetical protein